MECDILPPEAAGDQTHPHPMTEVPPTLPMTSGGVAKTREDPEHHAETENTKLIWDYLQGIISRIDIGLQ